MKLPDGYARDELLSLDFVGRAQDLVFYGKTGRGKTHLATALGMSAIDRGMNVRFLPTAELVLQLGRAKREGTLETMLKDIAKADLIILDEFGYVPFDVDGARLLYQVIAGSYERRSIILRHEHRVQQMGHDLRRRQTRRLDHRPHRSPRTTHRVHRTKPPHQPGTHVRQTPKPIKHTRPAHPRPKPQKIPDENRNTNLTKNTSELTLDLAGVDRIPFVAARSVVDVVERVGRLTHPFEDHPQHSACAILVLSTKLSQGEAS